MLVSEAVGAVLTDLGADTVFGVVGSGNFHVTNALIARGARFHAARHEGGAACMADGWARAAGRVGLLSVHQGPGLTNALTGWESPHGHQQTLAMPELEAERDAAEKVKQDTSPAQRVIQGPASVPRSEKAEAFEKAAFAEVMAEAKK